MSAKKDAKRAPGGSGRIPYLLGKAFAAAKQGDADEAWGLYDQAIIEGYDRDRLFIRAQLEGVILSAQENASGIASAQAATREPGAVARDSLKVELGLGSRLPGHRKASGH